MTESRDSIQTTLDDPPWRGPIERLQQDCDDLGSHVDRLYEKYHDLWEIVNEMMESQGVLLDSPLPLKYK